jgi:hypothetical protein
VWSVDIHAGFWLALCGFMARVGLSVARGVGRRRRRVSAREPALN